LKGRLQVCIQLFVVTRLRASLAIGMDDTWPSHAGQYLIYLPEKDGSLSVAGLYTDGGYYLDGWLIGDRKASRYAGLNSHPGWLHGGGVNLVLAIGLNGDDDCSSVAVSLGKSDWLVEFVLYSSDEPGELSQWHCHDDSTTNTVSK